MRILIVSTDRADWSGLQMVERELSKQHDIFRIFCWHHQGSRTTDWTIDLRHALTQYARAGLVLRNVPGAVTSFAPLDMAILAGDRYETLAAAQALHLMGVPIAHLAGGDSTPNSADDKNRYAITALATVHFPTHQEAANRLHSIKVVDSTMVFCVGSPAVDRLLTADRVPRETVIDKLRLPERTRHIVVLSIHPDTSGRNSDEVTPILDACADFGQTAAAAFVAVEPNQDTGRVLIANELKRRIGDCKLGLMPGILLQNQDPDDFIGLLQNSTMLIGNSSAGIYEAPILGVPSIIVGHRQDGRPRTAFRYVKATKHEVLIAMHRVIDPRHASEVADYRASGPKQLTFGDGSAAHRIARILATLPIQRAA